MFTTYSNLDYVIDMIDRSQLKALGQQYTFADKDNYYSLSVVIPGADKQDIKISVSPENVLHISYNPAKTNNFASSFSKVWGLKNADYEGLTAEYNNGILNVVVPKVKVYQTKARTFAVN